jgi:diguanylate cyclase (GGDEF)-like protein
MPTDPSVEAFELRLLFLRELGAGHPRAQAALLRLIETPADPAPLAELRNFFHRIGGTAAAVDLGLLGRLAAACEGALDVCAEASIPVSRKVLQVIEDGLAGAELVLRGEWPQRVGDPSAQRVLGASEARDETAAGASRILVVDDDPVSARLVDGVLRSAGFASSYCCDPEKAFEVIHAELPDLIILDVVMPQMDGFALCQRVRQSPALQLTPIIFVTRRGDVEQRVHGLSVGGNDYVSKPFAPQELVARVRSHLQRLAELREMAIRDGLTRCYNNKYFKQRLEQEMSRAKRYQTHLTIGMLDIDHFKRVNDTFGHPAGDAVLAHLASLLTASVRATDVVARYGGEEFSFLLIEAAVPEALVITNRMRERIAKHRFVLQALVGGEVEVAATASIGLSQMQADDTLEGLVSRADAALYKAKQGGRNRVEPG